MPEGITIYETDNSYQGIILYIILDKCKSERKYIHESENILRQKSFVVDSFTNLAICLAVDIERFKQFDFNTDALYGSVKILGITFGELVSRVDKYQKIPSMDTLHETLLVVVKKLNDMQKRIDHLEDSLIN